MSVQVAHSGGDPSIQLMDDDEAWSALAGGHLGRLQLTADHRTSSHTVDVLSAPPSLWIPVALEQRALDAVGRSRLVLDVDSADADGAWAITVLGRARVHRTEDVADLVETVAAGQDAAGPAPRSHHWLEIQVTVLSGRRIRRSRSGRLFSVA